MLEKFKKFLETESANVLYITGQAGTGKTTALKELVDFCMYADMNVLVCAHTHDACEILASKLSKGTPVSTTHSFLRKRPTINDSATLLKHIEVSRQHSTPKKLQILFIDEFSQIGEADYMDIIAACEDEDGEVITKVIYIGDKNQLPPVGDMQAVTPHGKWWIKLTHVWRQEGDNELLDTLTKLVNYIEEDEEPQPLLENKNFKRGVDLVNTFKEVANPILLAWTNERVEHLNAVIQGRENPLVLDAVFSPTTREHYLIEEFVTVQNLTHITKAFGGDKIGFGSKYKTLEHLLTMPDINFAELSYLVEGVSHSVTHAFVFGHYRYKVYLEQLKQEAADANKACEKEANIKASLWAVQNRSHPLAKRRAKAWHNFLTFKDCVICLDFNHAKTVHKSQGSTYPNVLIDTNDLHKCASYNFKLYLRLMYVAISRSSNMVYTN